MWFAVAEGECPQVVSRSWSVFGVIEQEPAVARPAGRKMPQPRLLQQHLLVAESGGGFLVDRVAETARRVGNAVALFGPHSGRIHLLLERETRETAARKVQRPEVARHAIRSIFHDSAGAIRGHHNTPVRSCWSERAQVLALPVIPGELEGSRSRCVPINENTIARHRKDARGVPRDLDALGDGHSHALELQAAMVEWLCHQRARAQKEEVAIREDRWHTRGQYPLTRLVPGVGLERTHVHALDVRPSGAEIQKVCAVGEERGPRVNELSLRYVDLRQRRGRATCRHSPERTARPAAPTPQHDVALTIPGA